MIASEPLPHFVDDLLGYLHETHPTHATLDGVHAHDDLLEDLSRQGDRKRDARARRLPAPAGRDQSRRADRRRTARAPHARRRTSKARMFELEEVRTWEKNPQYYSDILASSLAGQALFSHAPAAERARRVLSKLRQTPRLIQAARDNIKEPPGIFVKVGIETMRGALKFIDDDLPRAFAHVDDLHLLGDLADAQTEASQAVGVVRRVPRKRPGAARARRRSGSAASKFEQKLKLEEGVGAAGRSPARRSPCASCSATQEAFKALAGADERRRSARRVGADQGGASGARRARRRRPRSSSTSSRRFSSASRSSRLPPGEPITVAPTPDFYRWSFASMWTPGPFEAKADARVLLPDRRRSAPGPPSGRTSTCATTTTRRSGRSRFTRSIRGTSSTISICAASSRRRASRSCSRRRRLSKAGRTTASR